MDCPYRAKLLIEITSGRRSWSHTEVGGDVLAFRLQFVDPLRQLKYDGFFEALSEMESSVGYRTAITSVTILGRVSAIAAR